MTLVKMRDIAHPGLTRQEQEQGDDLKEYRGFILEKDPLNQELFYIKHKDTGKYLPGRFKGRRTMEQEINFYHSKEENKAKMLELLNDRPT